MKEFKIALVGVMSHVGRDILQTLSEHDFPVREIFALGTGHEIGNKANFGDEKVLPVTDVASFDFTGVDICFFSTDSATVKKYVPKATAAGAIVIDNSDVFRMDPDVPMIVPEVNLEALAGYKKRHIISLPSPLSIQAAVALKPLHDAAVIKRVVMSTYQSVSDLGRDAMDELFNQTKSIYVNDPLTKEVFAKQIAFNVIPHVGDFMEDGMTREEWNIMAEMKKLLGPQIKIAATCVRVPVFVGYGIAANIEFEKELEANDARALLKESEGISVLDHRHEEGFVTPAECVGEDSVFVSRVRDDLTVENGLSMWLVSDNLRKGSALNAVQIAEALVQDYLM